MKTEVIAYYHTDVQWDSSKEWPLVHVKVPIKVKLESLDVVSKMSTKRVYNYLESVRGYMYTAEEIEGRKSEGYRTIYKWVMDVYEILNKRKHKIPR